MEAKAHDTVTYKNAILQTIHERRAIRKFKDQPVTQNILDEILNAGRMAPSAINKQPWKFYILTDKQIIKSFSKEITKAAAKGILKSGIKAVIRNIKDALHLSHGIHFMSGDDPIFHGAPVVIFITAPIENEWASLDIGMCAQNMMLAAKSLGLDSCPVGLGIFVHGVDLFPKLGIPPSDHVLLSVVIGYGNETPEVHERIKNNVVYIDHI